MTKYTLSFLIILVSGLYPKFSWADTLILDRIKLSQSVNMPARGSSMNQVVVEFGEPTLKKQAVGEPPISVWKYKKFTVYFEKTWVINSVVNKITPQENGPKPTSRQ